MLEFNFIRYAIWYSFHQQFLIFVLLFLFEYFVMFSFSLFIILTSFYALKCVYGIRGSNYESLRKKNINLKLNFLIKTKWCAREKKTNHVVKIFQQNEDKLRRFSWKVAHLTQIHLDFDLSYLFMMVCCCC